MWSISSCVSKPENDDPRTSWRRMPPSARADGAYTLTREAQPDALTEGA